MLTANRILKDVAIITLLYLVGECWPFISFTVWIIYNILMNLFNFLSYTGNSTFFVGEVMLFILGFKCFVQFVKKMLVNTTEKWHRRNNNLIGGPDVLNNQMENKGSIDETPKSDADKEGYHHLPCLATRNAESTRRSKIEYHTRLSDCVNEKSYRINKS